LSHRRHCAAAGPATAAAPVTQAKINKLRRPMTNPLLGTA
jgi:hypothetical protein